VKGFKLFKARFLKRILYYFSKGFSGISLSPEVGAYTVFNFCGGKLIIYS